MLGLYLGALVVAIGVIVVQLSFGHDTGGGGHDVHTGGHDAAAWTMLASLRFWSFALLAFGLVGTLLHVFGLAGFGITMALAIASGFLSGALAVTVIRRLTTHGPSSIASSEDVAGRVGRVVVAVDARGPGKVRVDVRGSFVDVTARAREPIDVGESVIVEEMKDGEALVSPAPKELKA